MARHRHRRGGPRPVLTALAVATLLLSGLTAAGWAVAGPQRPGAEAGTVQRVEQYLAPEPYLAPKRYLAPVIEQRAARVTGRVPVPPRVTRPGRAVRPQLRPAPGLTKADIAAGLMDTEVIKHLSGRFDVVPGSAPAPGKGRVHRVRVEIEHGLNVDAGRFAAFVLATLNDPHSWGAGGRMTFARTDGAADVRVLLASPDTSARLCLPLRTGGTLSCRNGDAAVLTMYRWVRTVPDYGADRTGYRHYLVNHEVGHWLGHGHVGCPGAGRRAPVMMQQTKGLRGCAPNAWPFP
jgi:hypothetical protein